MTTTERLFEDPIVKTIVEYQRGPRRRWRRGKVSAALPGGFYDVIEITEAYVRRAGEIVPTVLYGRHWVVPANCIREAS